MSRGEGIKPLNNLFDKYKKILKAPQGSVVQAFCEVVEDVLSISITPEQVSYSVHNKTVSLQTPGAIKNEIKLHERDLLNHMKGRLGEKSAPSKIL